MRESPGIAKPFITIALPAAVGLVVLILGGLECRRILTTSARFEIRKVVVETDGPAKKSAILEAVNFLKGKNLFAVDLEDVKAEVEKNPWVAKAIVSRVLPGTVAIRYEEQKPRAILSMDNMYYLNHEGVPFYKIAQGDSLDYSIIQLDRIENSKDVPVGGIRAALDLLDYFQSSKVFSSEDIGQVTVRGSGYKGGAPLVATLAFPPKRIRVNDKVARRFVPVTLAEGDVVPQLMRAEAVMQHLAQAGKNPRLIRLELGKKIVVKIAP
jgi:hypothetical protein